MTNLGIVSLRSVVTLCKPPGSIRGVCAGGVRAHGEDRAVGGLPDPAGVAREPAHRAHLLHQRRAAAHAHGG
jgi:hypothetical protein